VIFLRWLQNGLRSALLMVVMVMVMAVLALPAVEEVVVVLLVQSMVLDMLVLVEQSRRARQREAGQTNDAERLTVWRTVKLSPHTCTAWSRVCIRIH
jgi:hypothetical protein